MVRDAGLPMKLLKTLLLFLAPNTFSVHGKCMVCPDGPDPSAADISKCKNLDTMYENITSTEECAGVQMAFMPTCCPLQLSTVAKDNACNWCPNGVSDIHAEVALPFSTESVTCAALMFGILGTRVDADICSFYNSVAPVCCPNDGGGEVAKCEFCPNGMDFPDTVLPSGDGSSCQDIQRYANLVFEGEMCKHALKPAEAMCCPSTTDSFVCDYCSKGLEYPDDMLDHTIKCSDIYEFSTFANETECSDVKISEALCCPSSTEISLPAVSEGDYCYLCGSANAEMKRPNHQPFHLPGKANDQTCAELERQMNEERPSGASCRSVVGSFTLFFSPSICGCDGFTPLNHCEICKGGSVHRAAMVPGQNFTCVEGFDFLKHASAAFCAAATEVDLEEIDAACCLYDGSNDGDGDEAADGSAANLVHVGYLILIVLSSFVMVPHVV